MRDDNHLEQATSSSLAGQQAMLDFDAADLPVDVDAALQQTIKDMLSDGDLIAAPEGSRWGSSWEQLHYTTGMTKPRARIGVNPGKRLNLVGAIARFVWMVGASDRLEDIAYYEDKVRAFTDNEISVPGSSYGRRIFEPSAGLNQIKGAVERLQSDPLSRQSAVVVWAPGDAVRRSADIPCTFGFFYHVRNGELVASTIMRSNNAFVLLPYNFFEFSLLAEVVAASVGVPFGRYVHWAASMHVYESTKAPAEKVVANGPISSLEMPPVPSVAGRDLEEESKDPNYALEQVRRLAALEPRLRNASTPDDYLKVLASSQDETGGMWLNDYWRSLFNVLVAWGAAKRGWWEIAEEYMVLLPDYLQGARFSIESSNRRSEVSAAESTETEAETPDQEGALLPLDLAEDLPLMVGSGFREIHGAGTEGAEPTAFQAEVEAACADWEQRHDEKMTLAEMKHVRENAKGAFELAARSQPKSAGASSEDRTRLSDEFVAVAIAAFRAGTE